MTLGTHCLRRSDGHHNWTQIRYFVIRITSVGTFPLYGARFQSRIAWIHDAEEWELGINPGGSVAIQEVDSVPEQYKNKLITDDDLLISLGSGGRKLLA